MRENALETRYQPVDIKLRHTQKWNRTTLYDIHAPIRSRVTKSHIDCTSRWLSEYCSKRSPLAWYHHHSVERPTSVESSNLTTTIERVRERKSCCLRTSWTRRQGTAEISSSSVVWHLPLEKDAIKQVTKRRSRSLYLPLKNKELLAVRGCLGIVVEELRRFRTCRLRSRLLSLRFCCWRQETTKQVTERRSKSMYSPLKLFIFLNSSFSKK